MPDKDLLFQQQRDATYSTVIARIEQRITVSAPALLLRVDEMSEESLRALAVRESWGLFLQGVIHLKEGAPGYNPGSMMEALTRMSLRSSSFAASLGIRPPHFEQMYFSVDYTTGHEAALFYCQKVIDAAAEDLPKSKQIIHRKILQEKPMAAFGAAADEYAQEMIRKQMFFSFTVLTESYEASCRDFKAELENIEMV